MHPWHWRTLEFEDGSRWRVPELYKDWLRFRDTRFIDVTEERRPAMSATTLAKKAKSSFPTHLRYQDELHDAFTHANDVGMRSDIQKLTSYYNRHYRSPTGRASQKWLQEQVEGLASKLPAKTTVTEFEHAWPQNSILLHIQGTNTTLTKERGVTILGAHQDSTNLFGWLPAPGADDDGSGTVTLLETLRALGKAGWAPQSDVEFHWYSAEEGGLIGSQAVVQSYVEKEAHVQAMLQMDMTAFLKEGTEERIGVVTDFVSPALTRYVENLIESYIGLPIGESKMKYGASDHASWDRYGFPSAFVMEAYTTRDVYTAPEYSFSHMLQFVRLSMAFAVELSGWASTPAM
ncbi:bacterial leucyl aminopeptidase precursor [Malassezia pachydermatis]|uniref:Peptide hydrolase n=1 Tax=Malassezia pachydermatis TaxID=77020 RepID=A0A0M8MLT3_9BASI|nr:bacterial leucyl aminopeptidase precursor [Malassezia pachydermatis]KOS14148.1 bacterial leucyl aminopeptidase precursor [Malassezia pachydermatis]